MFATISTRDRGAIMYVVVIRREQGDVHFLTGMTAPTYPTGIDMTIPEMMISLTNNGKNVQIVKNPKKEFLSIGGPYEINFEYTPKLLNLCGVHYPSDFTVSVGCYKMPEKLAALIKKMAGGVEWKFKFLDLFYGNPPSNYMPKKMAVMLRTALKRGSIKIIEPKYVVFNEEGSFFIEIILK